MTDTPDIEKFRLIGRSPQVKSTLPTKPSTGHFIKGPLPLAWITSAAKLPCHALNIGLALWYLAGLRKSQTVALTHRTLQEFHISPKTLSRMLRCMEEAGLIEVTRKRGCSPIITIITC